MNSDLVPKEIALFLSIVIPITFVLFVDWAKKIAASKILKIKEEKDRNGFDDFKRIIENELNIKILYRDQELKIFFPYSFLYLIFLMIFFLLIGPYFNFNMIEIYFSSKYNKLIKEKFIGTVIILTINFILYSGLLIQFFMGIEKLYPKTKISYFMENLYGPFLEEFIYRGFLFTLLKKAGYNGIKSAIYSSITFSLSHFRHIFDLYFDKNYPRLFFQSFYTLLFGFYTCYAYNFSGTIAAPFLLHCICNTLQMPRLGYLSDRFITKMKKHLISSTYIIGIISWFLLIKKYH